MLVDPEITRRKVEREVGEWTAHGPHAERGWLLLEFDPVRGVVDIGFMKHVSLSTGSTPLTVMPVAIRVSYDNYDLWPPSVIFIDPVTRVPVMPHVRAFQVSPEGTRDVLINSHPDTNLPFLCLPGVREYHIHPQHSGDDWLLHRTNGDGHLITICDRVWQYMVRPIWGISATIQVLPVFPLTAQVSVSLGQGDVDGIHAALAGKGQPVA